MEKFFRHKTNGIILSYTERLLNNPAVELVTEQEAFPERFASKAVLEHKQKVDISIPEELVTPPPYTPPELGAQKGETFKNVRMADKKKAKK